MRRSLLTVTLCLVVTDALDQLRARPLDGKALEVVAPWRRIVSC